MTNALRGEEVDHATNLEDFWANNEVKGYVNNILQKAQSSNINSNEHLTVLAYLAAILMFKNSQRPGVVENMTMDEYKKSRKDGDKTVIRVMKHKTAASTGPANIVVDATSMETMRQYCQCIRMKITAQNEELIKLFFEQ